MKIETKYNIGDRVWFEHEEREILCRKIVGIQIISDTPKNVPNNIQYTIEINCCDIDCPECAEFANNNVVIHENSLFATRAELLKTLCAN